MKTIRTIYTAFLFVVLAMLSACSTDSADPIPGEGESQVGKVTVHLKLSTASPAGSRAAEFSWADGSADENMKSWVVAFVKDKKVVSFAENKDVSADKSIRDDVTIKGLTNGVTYQVYSFANLSSTELGITQGATVDFDNKTWKMNGNGFDAAAQGIPMSNQQEITIDENGKPSIENLWVVRMLAKVTLKFKNPSSTPLEIHSITLNDITKNAEGGEADNIQLLPNHQDANKDEVVCEPNLASGAVSDSYTYTLSTPQTIAANTTAYSTDNEISFYVNESVADKTSKYFIVNLNTSSGVKRYALFKDWTTIARNDHHILPISLDDYKLVLDVEAFSAIGLFPSITDNGTTLSYTCYYPEEEFHIKPTVKMGDDSPVSSTIDYTQVKWELLTEEGISDAAAAEANALKVFKQLPSWNAKTGLFEGEFNGDAADRQRALYHVTVPVPGQVEKQLVYKVLFTKDLTFKK